jgi:hypothetical protein
MSPLLRPGLRTGTLKLRKVGGRLLMRTGGGGYFLEEERLTVCGWRLRWRRWRGVYSWVRFRQWCRVGGGGGRCATGCSSSGRSRRTGLLCCRVRLENLKQHKSIRNSPV